MAFKKVSPQTYLKMATYFSRAYLVFALLFMSYQGYKIVRVWQLLNLFESITTVTSSAVPILGRFEELGKKIMGKDFVMPKIYVGFDLKWGMVDGEPTAIGYCDDRRPVHVIALNKDFWDQASPLVREELLFHELGHCVLNREHAKTSARAPQPSIMVPNILPEEDYKAFRNEYILELFTKCDISKLINL